VTTVVDSVVIADTSRRCQVVPLSVSRRPNTLSASLTSRKADGRLSDSRFELINAWLTCF